MSYMHRWLCFALKSVATLDLVRVTLGFILGLRVVIGLGLGQSGQSRLSQGRRLG